MALVFRFFPNKDEEEALRASYHEDDVELRKRYEST